MFRIISAAIIAFDRSGNLPLADDSADEQGDPFIMVSSADISQPRYRLGLLMGEESVVDPPRQQGPECKTQVYVDFSSTSVNDSRQNTFFF